TLRLTVQSPSETRMPAKRPLILSRLVRNAVAAPANEPASAAASSVSHESQPRGSRIAETAAPSGKLPSTVRSGNASTRNVKKTPSADAPNASPSASAPIHKFIATNQYDADDLPPQPIR